MAYDAGMTAEQLYSRGIKTISRMFRQRRNPDGTQKFTEEEIERNTFLALGRREKSTRERKRHNLNGTVCNICNTIVRSLPRHNRRHHNQ